MKLTDDAVVRAPYQSQTCGSWVCQTQEAPSRFYGRLGEQVRGVIEHKLVRARLRFDVVAWLAIRCAPRPVRVGCEHSRPTVFYPVI